MERISEHEGSLTVRTISFMGLFLVRTLSQGMLFKIVKRKIAHLMCKLNYTTNLFMARNIEWVISNSTGETYFPIRVTICFNDNFTYFKNFTSIYIHMYARSS